MNTSINNGTMTKLLVFTFVALGTISCKEKEAPKQNSDSQNTAEFQTQGIGFKNDDAASIFKGYLELKNALVASNQETASEVANKMSELPGISGGDLDELLSNLAASDLAKHAAEPSASTRVRRRNQRYRGKCRSSPGRE